MDNIEKRIHEFVGMIYQNYGRVGCAVALLIITGVLVLAYYLLNRLPESKKVILWSKCHSCKYRCNHSGVFVVNCLIHEEVRWNIFFQPRCPHTCLYEGCEILYGKEMGMSAAFDKEDVPESMK